MDRSLTFVLFVAASEVLAVYLIHRIWRSHVHLVEKVALSLLALVPFAGPLFAWWLGHDPGPSHPAFRDNVRYRTDVLDRWRDVLNEQDPVIRLRKWKDLMARHKDGEV